MRATLKFEANSLPDFHGKISTTITKVGWGTKKATKAACEDILDLSLQMVPRDTNTLASAASYRIGGHWRTGFYGEVGYCIDKDPVNPKTGKAASSYVLAVHEDLGATHPVGGAKFLENAVRQYSKENFPRTVMKYVGEELMGSGGEVNG